MFYLCVSTLQLVPLSSYLSFPPTCETCEKGADQEQEQEKQEQEQEQEQEPPCKS